MAFSAAIDRELMSRNRPQIYRTQYVKKSQEAEWENYEKGKIDYALKIFQINRELYPAGFNTWDSLGECLLKLKRTEEGLAAYRRSLGLFPSNKHAIKALTDQNNE